MPTEDSVLSLLINCFDLYFEVFKKADNFRYANVNNMRFINPGPVALFTKFRLFQLFEIRGISEKHLEDISNAHIVSLVSKLITSAKDIDDLSIGFDQKRGRRRDELTNSKKIGGKSSWNYAQRRLQLCRRPNKTTSGLGYKPTLKRNEDDAFWTKL